MSAIPDCGCARRLANLTKQAAAKRAQGDLLRAEVRTILAAHPGKHLSGKHVLRYLTRDPLPSVRRIQEVLQELRGTDDAAPSVRDNSSPTLSNEA